MGKSQNVEMGVAWYTEEEWLKIKAAAADRHTFFDFYSEWRAKAQEEISNIRAAGINLVKVPVQAAGLLEWCRLQGVYNDNDARATYAGVRMAEKTIAAQRKAGFC